MAPKDTAEKLISSNKIAVFSKTYCPYCRNAKGIIKTLNVPDVGIIELDEDADGADIQNYLFEKTGQKTVPSIFIDGKHIGGSSDLASLESSGELKKLVAA